jgi:uncharacterized protein YjbI with pentapeptide repeats
MVGINWTSAQWALIKLTSPLAFYRCNVSFSSFMGLNLSEIVIEGCKAEEADFREADLSKANLAYTDFHNSQFIHCNLTKADFTESNAYNIDPTQNKIKHAKFSLPGALNLLSHFDIEINTGN